MHDMFISAISPTDANKELSCEERNNEITVNSWSAAVWQETEPITDILSQESSSEQKCDGDKRRDDNGNICADKMTSRTNSSDSRFPRLVDYCNNYSVMPFVYDDTCIVCRPLSRHRSPNSPAEICPPEKLRHAELAAEFC